MCLVLLTALINYSMMSNSVLTFLKNKARGLQQLQKNKVNQILKRKCNHNGVLQEKHSSIKNENVWVNNFSCPGFFSHSLSNSCSVLIAYLNKSIFSSINRKQIKLDKAFES